MSNGDDPTKSLARRRLGWGLALEPTHPGEDVTLDIAFEATGEAGPRRLALVSGIEALTQDLEVALTTARGSDPFDVDFGFDGINALAEPGDRMLVRERVRIAVVEVLRREPRVGRIVDVRLEAERAAPGEQLRDLGVTVQFETASGDTLTTTLGGRAVPDATTPGGTIGNG